MVRSHRVNFASKQRTIVLHLHRFAHKAECLIPNH
ncbi:hypothetical protein LF1_19930 [Rubripirellula obstinata]|uniref:Uncharacterized protein n=1 Tax=Rubripirellula obstinata TaxID=406547 RepID=A0A5B1CID1_9BACT|nr:hypothetical protein LF1_19930 [Rubripirellula obstinata]